MNFGKIARIISLILGLWVCVTYSIYSNKYPEKTRTQIAQAHFKYVFLDFSK